MTPLQQRILDHLFDTGRAQSLSAVTVALKEPQGDVYTALNTLRIQGAVVLNGYSKYRLENATKTRMGEEAKRLQHERGEKRRDDLPDPPEAPPMAPRDGLPEPGITPLTQPPNVGEHPLSPELVEERLAGIPEPTDAELDAIEAEEAEEAGSVVDDVRPVPAGGKRCGYRSGRENIDGEPWTCDLEPGHSGAHVDFGIGSSEADDDEPSVYDVEAAGTGKFPPAIGLVPAEPENSAPSALREQGRSLAGAEMREHVWGVARDRPTKGLRIEQLGRELVALDESLRGLKTQRRELKARRQELLEELGRLVG